MSVAQRLYENGFITYMRTDSTTLSGRRSARPAAQVASCTAPSTCRDAPRTYASKVKNAQEAHEAIRPARRQRSAPRRQTGLSGEPVPRSTS